MVEDAIPYWALVQLARPEKRCAEPAQSETRRISWAPSPRLHSRPAHVDLLPSVSLSLSRASSVVRHSRVFTLAYLVVNLEFLKDERNDTTGVSARPARSPTSPSSLVTNHSFCLILFSYIQGTAHSTSLTTALPVCGRLLILWKSFHWSDINQIPVLTQKDIWALTRSCHQGQSCFSPFFLFISETERKIFFSLKVSFSACTYHSFSSCAMLLCLSLPLTQWLFCSFLWQVGGCDVELAYQAVSINTNGFVWFDRHVLRLNLIFWWNKKDISVLCIAKEKNREEKKRKYTDRSYHSL